LAQPVATAVVSILQHCLLDIISTDLSEKIDTAIKDNGRIKMLVKECVIEISEETDQQVNPNKIQTAVEPLQSNLNHQESEITLLKQKISALESDLRVSNCAIDDQEQYSRRNCLKFINVPAPPETQVFDPLVAVTDICKLLGIEIVADQISRCHMLGEKKDDKATVLVKFVRYNDKAKVYKAKQGIKGNPHGRFIVESLTRKRQTIVNELNKLRRQDKIHSFWTIDGLIYGKKSEKDKRVEISNIETISRWLDE